MNWIDILVIVITCLIVIGIILRLVFKSKKGSCCSCPAVKHYKKDLKKAKKEIVDKNN